METINSTVKEQSIFNYAGNKIKTDDREISIIARFEEPFIAILANVLSEEECDVLIRLSKDRLRRSRIGDSRETHEFRTSSSMFFEDEENEVITTIEKRISQIMNIPIEHGEGIQILHYKEGQEFKDHLDYFSSSDNPRISTLVMYLNDVEQGGETYFPELNLSVSPQKGMAVYFEYFYNDQTLNEKTLHRGAPVIIGEKWAATQWMRRKKIKT